MAFNQDYLKWSKDSSLYIDTHRRRTFVHCLPDLALLPANLNNIISDIALLTSPGVRLVVVFGTHQQVSDPLTVDWPNKGEHRITSSEIIQTIIGVTGTITSTPMSRISASHFDSPGTKSNLPTVSGNFLRASPLGTIDGIDHLQSGDIRRVNADVVHHQLEGGSIVVIPTIGYSPSGEIFHLETRNTASQVARELQTNKLIYLTDDEGLRDKDGNLINELDLSHRKNIPLAHGNEALVPSCERACQAGVARCHVISYEIDGALLEELFTRDVCGTQIAGLSYERIRQAFIDGVPGILRLIEPLENEGVPAKRSRELLESEIEQFVVIDRDGLLISCAAFYPLGQSGEVACVVTHPDYRTAIVEVVCWIPSRLKQRKMGSNNFLFLQPRVCIGLLSGALRSAASSNRPKKNVTSTITKEIPGYCLEPSASPKNYRPICPSTREQNPPAL